VLFCDIYQKCSFADAAEALPVNEWNMGSVCVLSNSVVRIAVCTSKLNTQEKIDKNREQKRSIIGIFRL